MKTKTSTQRRKGAKRRAVNRDILVRAARMLEAEARRIFDAFSIDGKWSAPHHTDGDFNAWVDCEDMGIVARELRRFWNDLGKRGGAK